MDKDKAYQNTDREIYREREGDFYADSIHVTESGGIGFNCGGTVIVRPLRAWHALALRGLERAEPVAKHDVLALARQAVSETYKLNPRADTIHMTNAAIARFTELLYASAPPAAVTHPVVGWEVYVEKEQTSFVVDSLDDPQCIDSLTNDGATVRPLTYADAQPAASGTVQVSVDPTSEMLWAACENFAVTPERAEGIYRTMLRKYLEPNVRLYTPKEGK